MSIEILLNDYFYFSVMTAIPRILGIKNKLSNPKDYFKFFKHNLDEGSDPLKIHENVVQNLFDDFRSVDDVMTFTGFNSVINSLEVKLPKSYNSIKNDSDSVLVLYGDHKSILDSLEQKINRELQNPNTFSISGLNLKIGKYGQSLAHNGAAFFMRDQEAWFRTGLLQSAYLSLQSFVLDVFPKYLEQEIFEKNFDMLVFAQYDSSGAGRTKTGLKRDSNDWFIRKVYELSKKQNKKVYLGGVNVSYSKIIDAPFVVKPVEGFLSWPRKLLRYRAEQSFIFEKYPKFAQSHPESKLDVSVNYTEPFLVNDVASPKKFIRNEFKEALGNAEVIYPIQLICQELSEKTDMSVSDLIDGVKKNIDYFKNLDVQVNLSDNSIENVIHDTITLINSNPRFSFFDGRSKFYDINAGRIYNLNDKLTTWYSNTIEHLKK